MSPSDCSITGFVCLALAIALSAFFSRKSKVPDWVYDILFFLISVALLMIVVGSHLPRV